jgi:NAD(P)-dependent dehydrogenase (short-subunit alcohol dehydrogenase family)
VIVLGTLIGVTVLVVVGTIGTRTGLPTMILTRGAFGRRGGHLPAVFDLAAVPSPGPFVGGDVDQWSATVSDGLTQPFQMIRASLPSLRRDGSWRVVLIGAGGWFPSDRRECTAAAAVHGGQVALVKTLGRELGHDGISVNEVVFDPDNPPPAAVVADTVAYLCGPYGGAVVGQLVTIGSDGEARP